MLHYFNLKVQGDAKWDLNINVFACLLFVLYPSLCQMKSLTVFIYMKLPKQLQPSTKNAGTAGWPHEHPHCVISPHTLTHTHIFYQPLSNPLVSIPGGIGLNNGMMGRVLFGGLGG